MTGCTRGESDSLKTGAEALASATIEVATYLKTHPAPTEYRVKRFLGIKYGKVLVPEGPEASRNRQDLEILVEEIQDVEGRLWAVQRRIENARLVEQAAEALEDSGAGK